jgi:hypothetical protein
VWTSTTKRKTIYNKAARRRQLNLKSYWTLLSVSALTSSFRNVLFSNYLEFRWFWLRRRYLYPWFLIWPICVLSRIFSLIKFLLLDQPLRVECILLQPGYSSQEPDYPQVQHWGTEPTPLSTLPANRLLRELRRMHVTKQGEQMRMRASLLYTDRGVVYSNISPRDEFKRRSLEWWTAANSHAHWDSHGHGWRLQHPNVKVEGGLTHH